MTDTRYRTREEIESLFGDGFENVRTELIETDASYTGYDEFWSVLSGGAGPAGAWLAALEGERREAAHAEIHRQLGEPDGPFTLTREGMGDAGDACVAPTRGRMID